MTKQKSNNMPVGVLQCLFDNLSTQIDPNINPILQIADDLNLSKESVYRRFRSETAFTLHELWLLSKSYEIPFHQMFNNALTDQIPLNLIGISSTSFNQYVSSMYDILQSCNQSPYDRYFYFANAVPLHYILQNQTFSELKFLLWNHLFGFNKDDLLPIWNKKNTKLNLFCVNEVWSSHVSEAMIEELDFTLACGIKLSMDFMLQWYLALSNLIKSRLFQDDMYTHDLYQSEINIPTTVLTRIDSPSSIAVIFSDVLIGYTANRSHQLTFGRWAKNILKHCIKLSDQSARLKQAFYVALMEPIQVSASKRLPQNLYSEFKRITQSS